MIDKTHIGRSWSPYETVVEQGRLLLYAKAIGETNPIHCDPEAARAAGYRGLVAPPTFAFCLGFDEPDQFRPLRDLGVPLPRILHGEQTIRHHGEICAGDRLRCTRRVADIYSKKDGAMEFVAFETTATNVASGDVVAELTALLVVRNP